MIGRPPVSVLAIVAVVVAACGGSGGGSSAAPPPHAEDRPADENSGGGGDYRPPVTPNIELHNACTDAVPIYFGEQPNGTTGDFVTLRGDSTSHVPRREHGELTVWIVDDKGFGLAHVKVTRRMKRVEIGPSCRTLHAD